MIVVGLMCSTALAPAAEPDWKAVEQALGKPGQLQEGGVFRVGMPRPDLSVTVKGVAVKAGFALGSYAAFKPVGDQAMVMGAVHNHLNEVSSHVMYMHYEGHGAAVQLATSLRQALSASATPLGAPPAPATALAFDPKPIEQALGRPGRDLGAGVFQVTVPRAEPIMENGMTGGKAAITGDFVLAMALKAALDQTNSRK